MVSTALPVCVPRQAEAPVDGGVKQSSDGKRIGRGQWGSLWVLFFLFLYFVSRVKSFERCEVYEWSRLSGSRYGIECVLEACRMVVTPIKCNQDWTSVTGRSANVIMSCGRGQWLHQGLPNILCRFCCSRLLAVITYHAATATTHAWRPAPPAEEVFVDR